jgi:hypothetical protein
MESQRYYGIYEKIEHTSPTKSKPNSAAVFRVPSFPKMNEGSPQCGHLK